MTSAITEVPAVTKVVHIDTRFDKAAQVFVAHPFFEDFIWENFRPGDVVWLEDFDEAQDMAGIFRGIVDGAAIITGTDYAVAIHLQRAGYRNR